MEYMINHPRVLAVCCLLLMWLMGLLGVSLRGRLRTAPDEEDKDNLSLVVGATLTLLGLIIGFTFSMAASRYDQRRLYEEGEANAIGTEYLRADLMPAADGARVKQALREYVDWRLEFYRSDYGSKLQAIDAKTERLQGQLWASVLPAAAATPTPVMALVVAGMNDVINAQGYTQFSWWNRIPGSAWGLMIGVALFANLLVGYATRRTRAGTLLLLVLPLTVSLSFFLVSDIDSPQGGVIRVQPVNLASLAQQLRANGQ